MLSGVGKGISDFYDETFGRLIPDSWERTIREGKDLLVKNVGSFFRGDFGPISSAFDTLHDIAESDVGKVILAGLAVGLVGPVLGVIGAGIGIAAGAIGLAATIGLGVGTLFVLDRIGGFSNCGSFECLVEGVVAVFNARG